MTDVRWHRRLAVVAEIYDNEKTAHTLDVTTSVLEANGTVRFHNDQQRSTEELASVGGGAFIRKAAGGPQNTGSQRLLRIAAEGDRYDRAMWTATAKATGGSGNSNALVGTPETVAAALLDYVDLGVDILSARGYDLLDDARDFGKYVIPIVREEVAKRDRELASASA